PALPPLTRRERPDVLPLSFAQQRLWFIHQFGTVDAAYHVPFALKLEGTLDLVALRRSFDALMHRHEALRTTFRAREGTPEQVIHPVLPLPMRQLDLVSITDPEQRRAEATRLLLEETRTPFDLEQGPLIRALLLKLSPTEHVLVLNQHHIVSDGWSTGVLVREMGTLYAALSRGLSSALPELPVQYADHALWQRDWLRGAVLEHQLGHWSQQLEGAPSHLELPTDHPRPARQSFQGALMPLALPRASSEALEALARREGVTPFMVLLAAFQVLLGRYAGQDDVLVGSPIAGRRHAESEALIGYFANTVVLRTRLHAEDTFRALLTRVRDTTLGAYEHQDLPFEKLVEALHPTRDPSRTPFFQVTFTLQNAPLPKLELPGLSLQPMNADPGAIRFDLEWLLHRAPEGFAGGINFNTALFAPATVARMSRHLRGLLDAAVASPATPLSRLPWLTVEERQQVLETWSGTATDFPREASVPALFTEQAARTPDAIAVRAPGSTGAFRTDAAPSAPREFTYAELERQSNQLAHHLRRLGVRPGDRVGLCVERSLELITGLLGILKAGAAYVPVEAKAPTARTTWSLQEAGVSVLVTQEALAEELPAVAGWLVLLDAEADLLAKQPVTPLDVRVPAEALAYVMFTSGSTGRPKGVTVPHRGIVRLVRGSSFLHAGPGEVFLQVAPVAFDASTLEVWGPLLNGAKLVLAPPAALSLSELATLLTAEGITTLWLTAALFEQMVLHEGPALARVRQVLAGGDVLPVPRVREHLSRMAPDAVLVNGYGPTENTTFSATHSLRAGDTVEGSVPIGRPLANSTAWVLDAALEPMPPGVPGELYVGGDGLAWGYLQRPDLTAERFIPHPFATRPGSRLYRTGDRTRWREDGTLEFMGRTDFQVKIRGFRIEPGEVEAVLRQSPDVREAVVLAREDVPGEKRLVAYVVCTEAGSGTDRVKAFARQQLPDPLVPSAWVELPALPLSPNGKVDRKALPLPEAAVTDEATRAAPRDAMEARLVAIWAEVLRLEPETVGIHDDFFEHGGHSLLATQVVSRIRGVFGVELPLGELFNAPTVAALAPRLATFARTSRVPPLTRAPRPTVLPLSFAQQRLWFIDQMEPGSSLYNMPFSLTLLGALDEDALQGSLDALMARHESLRTTFRTEAGQPAQHIHTGTTVPLERVDLSRWDNPEERQQEAERLATAETRRPFDLAKGPVIRALLLKLATDEHVLVLHLHHIVSDGWSMGVLVRELTALYEALHAGRTPRLPALPVQYADFALWQRGWLQGEALEAQLDWWRRQLDGAPQALELPTDKPRPATSTQRGDTVPVHLPRRLTEQVEALAQREGATPFMVLLAAFQTVLHRYSGQDDVLVGSPIANRRHAETEGLIGFFVNTLVLRGRFGPRTTFRELLAQVRATTLGAYEHQDLPFERLVESLQPTRDLGRTPFFQVMFALQNAPVPELSVPGLTVRPARVGGRTTSQFDLSLELAREGDAFQGVLEYATDLFERSTAERLITHLRTLLEAALARPEAPLRELSLLPQEERDLLLGTWSGGVSDFDRDATLHGRIEQQAALTPDAGAVMFGETTLSFRQLNARANQLARDLRARGVGPEVMVGLCLERSVEIVVALLAVLKAGGAFVPIDPGTPSARKSLVLRDCGATVLLTSHALAEAWRPDVAQVVRLDTEHARIAALPEEDLPPSAQAGNLAYVIYTSGSTGTPKGVMVRHRSLIHLHNAMARTVYAGQPRGLRIGVNAPLTFDSSIDQIIQIIDGHCLCPVPEEMRLEPERMLTWLEEARVDTMDCTPAQLKLLLDAGLLERKGLPSLLLVGGEALDEVRWRQLAATSRTRTFNTYGPTECTVDISVWNVQGTSLLQPTIGRPLDNLRVHVLDERQQLVPFGLPGELCVSGEGVSRGYLGRPHLTAERFVPDPFGTEPGGRMYRTGDKVRWREDGTLDFMGRLDFQVKLRGYRIELGEIEATSRAFPGVRDAVALLREDTPGQSRLVVYVMPDLDTAALREHLRQHLPGYMVPTAIVALPVLPLTPNGKVDRRALPVPDASHLPASTYEAPATLTEERLAALWAELLRVPTVGRHDNFFELGGHSLLATQVVARVRSRFSVELPVRTLFESPTVAALARRLPDATTPALPPLTRAKRDVPPPLSFAQQRLWFIDQLEPGSSLYNMPFALTLLGTLDEDALRGSLDALMARHEALRTTFRLEEGQPVQHLHDRAQVPLERVDLTGMEDSTERQREAERLATAESQRPFDLERGPVIRALLLKLGTQEHVLVLHLHHIVSDGWSMGVLAHELTAVYEALREGRTPMLPELPVQYADFALWQRGWLQGEALDVQLDWWKQQLEGAPRALELPTDKPRPAVATRRGDTVPVHLPRDLTEQVEALARREGATPFMVLLAAFQALLHRYSGQDDVLVGSPIANRRHAVTEGLIGFFVNTLVLRGSFGARTTFRELLAQVRTNTMGAYEHQDVPFERLVEALQTTRDLGRTPLFQVLFALQNAPVAELSVPGLTFRPAPIAGRARSQFDLSLELHRGEDGFQGTLEYATDLFERSTPTRLVAHLRVLLEAALARPEAPLRSLSLVTPEERKHLLELGNGGVTDFDRDATLHGRIEEQADRTPQADAVVFGETTLSFQELNARANQLAWDLRARGVGPEVPVGLCLERSAELIVALLAVLKAGGAFVPLDPNAPAARRSQLLRDCGATVLVTSHALAGEWNPEVAHVVRLDAEQGRLSTLSRENPPPSAQAGNLAYVIYTSGSTGLPKGVTVRHRSVLHLHRAMTRSIFAGLEQGRRVTVNAPLYFDASIEQALQLIDGHCLYVVPDDVRLDPERMLAWLEATRVEVLDCTPGQLKPLLDAGLLERAHVPPVLIVGGEALDDVHRRQLTRTSRTRTFNAYGPTECTVSATVWSLQDTPHDLPIIGRPLENLRAYVLDERQQLVPFGLPGELCFAGEGLARGYLGQPHLTAERFVPDPFNPEPGARLYRTGDKARWREDGTLDFMGRLDLQVKLRGHRIEPGEIEAVLRTHPGVRDAVVLIREDVPGDARLVAYVASELDTAAPREHLRQHLPGYMVPTAIIALPTLPLTPNG
ncbi:non-ribosomal peptide synthetase, partial [Corallococcus terminator]